MKIIRCNYCGRETEENKENKTGQGSYILGPHPKGWGVVKIQGDDAKDICPTCEAKLK